MYAGSPSAHYLAPTAEGEDVLQPLARPLEVKPADNTTVYVFFPERVSELAWVQASRPKGSLRDFRRADGELLFAAYEPD